MGFIVQMCAMNFTTKNIWIQQFSLVIGFSDRKKCLQGIISELFASTNAIFWHMLDTHKPKLERLQQ